MAASPYTTKDPSLRIFRSLPRRIPPFEFISLDLLIGLVMDELKKYMEEEESFENAQPSQDCTNWKSDVYSKAKGPEKKGQHVRCLGKVPQCGKSNTSKDDKIKKLESLVGDFVGILQVRFVEDPQIISILQAVAQEVSAPAPCSNSDYSN